MGTDKTDAECELLDYDNEDNNEDNEEKVSVSADSEPVYEELSDSDGRESTDSMQNNENANDTAPEQSVGDGSISSDTNTDVYAYGTQQNESTKNTSIPTDSTNTQTDTQADTAQAENTQGQTQTQTNTETLDLYISGGFPLYNYGHLDGSYLGRARIPAVGVNVAIYNSLSQSVCNAWDSACFAYAYSIPAEGNYSIVLADHQNQGFSAIKNCSVGTALYIDGANGNTYKYVCDWIDYNGYNDSVYLYNSNGQICDNGGGVYAYTCNNSYGSVTIVHFSSM